ncbi:uncharacterized protein LOC116721974 [Tachysurus ichikawai]
MKELTALDPNKAAGSVDLAPVIAAPLTVLINLSLYTAEIPPAWKEAVVLPLYKGGDQADLNNYRPISILPWVSKILEILVNKQLINYLNVNGIISGAQSGFRSGYGCVTATTKVLNDITSALDNKQNCAAIVIDLAKAFDSVDHNTLIHRLSSIGVTDHSLVWFSNYLSHRVQRVRFENLFSHSLPVTRGVPQGSILGPTLFSIYINNIPQAVGNSLIHLFADDTILYAIGPSSDAVQATLQHSFYQLQQSFTQLNLTINTSKTKSIWFCRRGTTPPPALNITTCKGAILEQVTAYNYLGIWLETSLSFSIHISKL